MQLTNLILSNITVLLPEVANGRDVVLGVVLVRTSDRGKTGVKLEPLKRDHKTSFIINYYLFFSSYIIRVAHKDFLTFANLAKDF